MVPWYKQYYHRLWECLPYLSCIAFIGLKYCFCPLQKILLEDVRIIYVEYLYLDADWALNLKEMLESNEVFWMWTRSPQPPRPDLLYGSRKPEHTVIWQGMKIIKVTWNWQPVSGICRWLCHVSPTGDEVSGEQLLLRLPSRGENTVQWALCGK